MAKSEMTAIKRVRASNRICCELEKHGYFTRAEGNLKYIYKFDQKVHLKKVYGFITSDLKVVMY